MKISNKQKYLIINFFGSYQKKVIALECIIIALFIVVLRIDWKFILVPLVVVIILLLIAYKPIGFAMKIGRFDKKLSIHKLPFVNFNKAFAKSLNILKNKIKKGKIKDFNTVTHYIFVNNLLKKVDTKYRDKEHKDQIDDLKIGEEKVYTGNYGSITVKCKDDCVEIIERAYMYKFRDLLNMKDDAFDVTYAKAKFQDKENKDNKNNIIIIGKQYELTFRKCKK